MVNLSNTLIQSEISQQLLIVTKLGMMVDANICGDSDLYFGPVVLIPRLSQQAVVLNSLCL